MSVASFGAEGGISRDELKIQLKRESNERRRERLMNPRQIAIGLDVDALDAQVAEVQKSRASLKQSDLNERMRIQEIDRILEMQAEEERKIKSEQMLAIKQSWSEALTKKEQSKLSDKSSSSFSGTQVFAGEDENRSERLRAQKEQMRQWIQEQVAEKAFKKESERDSDANYASMLRSIDEIREAAEREESEARRAIQLEVITHNEELKQMKQERNFKEEEFKRRPLEEQLRATSLDLFNEDAATAMDSNGRIIRKEMFKGFTAAQKRRIYQENETVRVQNRERDFEDRQRDYEWSIQQMLVGRAMEAAHLEEQSIRDAEKERHLAILARQRDEEAVRKQQAAKAKYGGIEPGFFNNFGTSHR